MLRIAIVLGLALAAFPPQSQTIFKCIDPAGKVEYRHSACPSGTKGTTLEMPVTTGKMLAIRRSDESETRRQAEAKILNEVPVRAAQPSEPVNALPPPPAKEK